METSDRLEGEEGWGERGEDWARLHSLLEIARRAHLTELSPERRDEIRARVLERLDKREARRRRVRALVAGASAVLLAGLALAIVIRARAG